MDKSPSPNGHHADERESTTSANPYVDAVTGARPSELVEFELHTDPYANMLPRVSSITRPGEFPLSAEDDLLPARRRRNPLFMVVSVLLILVLVLPVMAEVFARLLR